MSAGISLTAAAVAAVLRALAAFTARHLVPACSVAPLVKAICQSTQDSSVKRLQFRHRFTARAARQTITRFSHRCGYARRSVCYGLGIIAGVLFGRHRSSIVSAGY